MTATTMKVGTDRSRQILDRVRRAALAIRHMASAIGAQWQAALEAGQLGPDAETIIGRSTGARI